MIEHEQTRWLLKRGDADYGPFSTAQVLEAIVRREVDLGTLVCDITKREWEPAGVHAIFRDHYAGCEKGWAEEELHSEADSHARSLERGRVAKRLGHWALVALVLLSLVGGGWWVWRVMTAKPTGIMGAVRMPQVTAFAAPPPNDSQRAQVRPVEPKKVAKLRSARTAARIGSSAGVLAEGEAAPPVTRLDFDGAEGELDEVVIQRIAGQARKALEGCMGQAARKSESFREVRVGFVVRSGRLDSFTVSDTATGNKAFKACVRRVLRRISVPAFGGSERRITIPLSVSG